MLFEINITGIYNNIKGVKIAQKFYMNLVCGTCNTPYKNIVFIDRAESHDYSIKNNKHIIRHCNLIITCKNCENKMTLKVTEPESRIIYDEENEEGYTHPIIGNKCHVSSVISDSAIVKDVDGLILDVVSQQNEVFKNCDFEKRILAEDDHKGKTVYISDFKVEVNQVK